MGFTSVGIVGAGPVGCAIAIAVARMDVPVFVVPAAHGAPRAAERRIEARLRYFMEAGEMSAEEVARAREGITWVEDLASLSDCDLVIESSAGDDRSRRAVLATVESRLSAGAVLATNSPPERLLGIAEVLRRRDQLVGMHFFAATRPDRGAAGAAHVLSNPPPSPATRLVELGLLGDTAPGVAAACKAFARTLGTTTVERSAGVVSVGYREFLS